MLFSYYFHIRALLLSVLLKVFTIYIIIFKFFFVISQEILCYIKEQNLLIISIEFWWVTFRRVRMKCSKCVNFQNIYTWIVYRLHFNIYCINLSKFLTNTFYILYTFFFTIISFLFQNFKIISPFIKIFHCSHSMSLRLYKHNFRLIANNSSYDVF